MITKECMCFPSRIEASFTGVFHAKSTVPTKLLGTPPFFQCILMALRVLEKMQ
jgi:hypothetical protein